MDEVRKKAINALMARRNALSRQYDEILSQPESYSIVGSVSATNHKLEEIRKEISALDDKIETLCGARGGLGGVSIRIPDYRCPYIHVEEELNSGDTI